jgi:hypothetical protein
MYAKGDGKPKDPAKAAFWRERYEKDKLAYERAQQQAQEAQRQRVQAEVQQNQEAGVLMLQLLLGAFSADSDRNRSGPDGLDRYNGFKSACEEGYFNACGQIGAPPPE